ncbi:phosphoribosylanthranilate isomerase [Candidatus Poribacteria bacterium]|nr:phosphoribosylanthranilate isomerase [Candidatus Poribacteria bacterium]
MVNNKNKNRCKVKICGITSVHDAALAKDAGADYVGILVDVASSERSLQITKAIEIADECPIPTVLLLYNKSSSEIQDIVKKIRPDALQLLGQESPSQVEELKKTVSCQLWKSVYLPAGNPDSVDKTVILEQMQAYTNAGADYLLFDTVDTSQTPHRYGGTGKTCDWDLASLLISDSPLPVFFAGGIRPENVKNAIETMNPYGIDLCSGVEASKGVKDHQKLISLMDQIEKARISN